MKIQFINPLCEHECKNGHNFHVLHGTGIKWDGVEIFGLGGGIPVTPFGSWRYDFTERRENCFWIVGKF